MIRPRRILIVHPYGIGDALFVTPVLRALRLLPSVEKIHCLLGSRTEAVFRSNPHVDKIISLDQDKLRDLSFKERVLYLWKLTQSLQAQHYDTLIDYSQRQEYSFWAKIFLKIPYRVGFSYKKRGLFLTHKILTHHGFEKRHAAEYFGDVLKSFGGKISHQYLEFYLEERHRNESIPFIPSVRYVVIAPGGGESWGKDAHFKRWPAQNFVGLMEKMKSHVDFEAAVIVGTAHESDLAKSMLQKTGSVPLIDLTGKLSLELTAAVIEKSQLFLGNDGGLLHLSQALGVPALACYGPVDPEIYGPYPKSSKALAVVKENLECRPCYKRFRYQSDCAHRDCLQALSVEEVYQAFLRSPLKEEESYACR